MLSSRFAQISSLSSRLWSASRWTTATPCARFLSGKTSSSSGCCPSGSWGQLKEDKEYVSKGNEHVVDGLKVYVCGKEKTDKCVIWNYDIYGFNGGRTRMLVDNLAQQGFLVLLPDYFRGEWMDAQDANLPSFLRQQSQWPNLKEDYEKRIRPLAKDLGATKFAALGTCWGSYVVLRLAKYEEMLAGVSMHPSHSPISNILEEEERQLLEGAKNSHQLFCPAKEDHANCKKGGLAEKVLGNRLEIVEFTNMSHGFTTRGDFGQANVKDDVAKAMQLATDFLKKHLQA